MSERARVERQSRKKRETRVAASHARGHVRVSRISLDRLTKKTVVSLKFKVFSGGALPYERGWGCSSEILN